MKFLKAKAMLLSALISVGSFSASYGAADFNGTVAEKAISSTALGQNPEVRENINWTPPELKNSKWADDEIYDARVYGLVTYDLSRNIQSEISRADAAEMGVVLYEKLTGEKQTGDLAGSFSDTSDRYVLKAERLGIVKGKGNGIYDPDSSITREDLSVIMYNSIEKAGSLNFKENSLASFEDGESASDYAKAPLDYMISNKIIKGRTPTMVYPKASTTKEESLVIAKRIYEKLSDFKEKSSKGLFYKASDGKTDVYVLGSIHMVNESAYPMTEKIREIYEKSNTLSVEVDILNEQGLSDEIMAKAVYTDGKTLKDDISVELYNEISELLTEHSVLTIDDIKDFKPWYLNMVLPFLSGLDGFEENDWKADIDYDSLTPEELEEVENLPYKYTPGIDMYFLEKAANHQIKVEELEGSEYQINMLSKMSIETQKTILQNTVRDLVSEETEKDAFSDMISYWSRADRDSFENVIESNMEEMPEEYNKALWDIRNKEMTDKIESYIKSGESGHFVVVGAGHLVSDSSIVKELESRGYSVEMIK